MRMKKVRLALLAILPGLLVACSTTRPSAPVIDRTTGVRSGEAPGASSNASPQSARRADNRGYYAVRKGDTLVQIALEFGQSYRDLVAWNNLSNPNDIKVDQELRVIPPEGGPQTGSVTTASGVEVRPLNAPAAAANTHAPNKTGPRGDKRTYSESAMAESQKSDGGARAESPKVAETKGGDKVSDTPGATGSDEDSIAWIWPADGKVISGFSDGKKGIDIAGKIGQPVVAAGAGKVLYAGSGIRGYGNLVILKHTNNLLSAYAHNKTIFVKEDQTVNKGQKIAEMGNSDTDAVKLHFEIRQQGKPVDPSKFLPSR
jgi:lipoprotein NlpD